VRSWRFVNDTSIGSPGSIANNFDERKEFEQDAVHSAYWFSLPRIPRLDDVIVNFLKKCMNQSTAKLVERSNEIPIVLASLASVTSDASF
jgi:hypothetical protein